MSARKPTVLRSIEGNRGHRPLPPDEPQPEVGGEMPEGMSEGAQKLWPTVAKQLTDVGVLTKMDVVALRMFCETYVRWIEADDKLRHFGPLVTTPNGFLQPSPYWIIVNKAQEQLDRLLQQFGMTPASRTKVHVAKRSSSPKDGEEKRKPADAYFKPAS